MKNLREYMAQYKTSAKILVLTGLAAIVGGCYQTDTDRAIAGASSARAAMQSHKAYTGQSERYPITRQSEGNTGQSRGYTPQLSESHFHITGDGTNYVDVDGVNVSKFVRQHREMFKEGYEAAVYNAKTGKSYKTATGKFKKN